MSETLEQWADRAVVFLDELERDLRMNAPTEHGRDGDFVRPCRSPWMCDRCTTLARADRIADLAADRRRL